MPSPPSRSRRPGAITRARLYIDERYTQRLTLREVAQAVKLSPTYLCRAFKTANRCTLLEYLSRRRIDTARTLLRDTALMVKEVAFVSGFQSVAHFNRVFKEANGVAPLEFRRQALAARTAAALAM